MKFRHATPASDSNCSYMQYKMDQSGSSASLTFLRTAPLSDSLSCWMRMSHMRQCQRRIGKPGMSTLTRSASPFTTLSCIKHIVVEASGPAYRVHAAAHASALQCRDCQATSTRKYCTLSAEKRALCSNIVPEVFWQALQWHFMMVSGGASHCSWTVPQTHSTVSGSSTCILTAGLHPLDKSPPGRYAGPRSWLHTQIALAQQGFTSNMRVEIKVWIVALSRSPTITRSVRV